MIAVTCGSSGSEPQPWPSLPGTSCGSESIRPDGILDGEGHGVTRKTDDD